MPGISFQKKGSMTSSLFALTSDKNETRLALSTRRVIFALQLLLNTHQLRVFILGQSCYLLQQQVVAHLALDFR
jgi:hypothetical protein